MEFPTPQIQLKQSISLLRIVWCVFFILIQILIEHPVSIQQLEKYLNLEGFLEKSLKIKYALKKDLTLLIEI